MRPAAYRDHLVDLLKRTPDVQRAAVVEGGKHPYAFAATVAGTEHRWQVMGQLAEGAKHEPVTPAVHGQPAEFVAALATAAPDAWLAGVVGAAEAPDTQKIDVWTARGNADPGLTVHFHNGEKAFVRLV